METYVHQLEAKVQRLEADQEDLMYQLYNWMILAIRLDYNSRGEPTASFDKEALFNQIQNNRFPYTTWPKMITRKMQEKQQ